MHAWWMFCVISVKIGDNFTCPTKIGLTFVPQNSYIVHFLDFFPQN